MTDAVVVSTARTGLAKSWRGSLNMTHPVTFTGHVLRHAIERARIDPAEVEDVIVGATFLEGAAGMNVARQVALRAGCPVGTAGISINRFCSSGLQSIALAAQRIMAGEGDIYAAGGLESITCIQNRRMRACSGAVGDAAQAGDLLEHAADGGERREALPYRPAGTGRVRRAKPAARRRRGPGRDDSRGDRPPRPRPWRLPTRTPAPSARER